MPKRTLRRLLLERRRSLTREECLAASRVIQETFIRNAAFESAGAIALYAPIHGEVDTASVAVAALGARKTVAFPVVAGDNMVFRTITSLDELEQGAFGIMEPPLRNEALSPDTFDLIVLPGVAFDLRGNRIGYGKGYYDRLLHPLEGKGRLVGFCHDFQLVDSIAGEPHDVRLDLVITEKRVIRPPLHI
ncbi:MAG: 5-formyltetrahydrofolate cyclo-ligase [Geobacter sp.]|nr:5-formyltetrahydrofolate cyclo-ligase [Geobacter sp.]